MTSMEAACESGRHAVNAILDHYIWVESGGADRRGETSLDWRTPYGFVDQGLTTPVRMPSPAGDYCYVVDLENREPLDTRTLRNFNADYGDELSPPAADTPAGSPAGTLTPPSRTGGQPMTSPMDYNQHLLAYVQAWRQLLEASAAMTSRLPFPPGMPAMPGMPPMPPTARSGTSAPSEPADRLRAAAVQLPADVAAVPRAGDRHGAGHAPCRRPDSRAGAPSIADATDCGPGNGATGGRMRHRRARSHRSGRRMKTGLSFALAIPSERSLTSESHQRT